jgi:hypothetical protein
MVTKIHPKSKELGFLFEDLVREYIRLAKERTKEREQNGN